MLTKEIAAGTLAPGMRVYAIGDIHGRRDLLDRLADQIGAHLSEFPCDDARTVFLGDYIDRGRHSRAIIDRLARGDFPTPFVALRGNHEAKLFEFLENADVLDAWRQYGAIETLASYGVDVREALRGRGFARAQEEFRAALPSEHLDFLRGTALAWSCGGYFFCHAGVKPGVALSLQEERDLLWIRYEFLKDRRNHGKIVVHGHTPVAEPESLPNRINVDTGAYSTGILSCLVLEGAERRFLSTRSSP